ncbi:MAG TPA: TetR/AcrR family transcriptional regulator [Spirochaetota bacterium]|nr:TetR/AcrR family transcriptional regulator [Spirochaetota bacterium]HPC40350.1 TetR/AcrR family transcriptional regulator [Spirochaetota bacterium]HPL16103.1 TetR/AcrR family transcriptional regulator [Spirochaetota bacterium]HQF07175.1 TetR/AcrR family transcriptional regulator [Spirochaetota bacterium]HQH96074.1 TetR/AcrR family transcriptional regulator [Spirochaetota bacterium]
MGSQERREREKEARKDHILKAARTLLLKKGLHATTVNQIAKLSELSVGTIYLYYHNKEDIFAALQEEGLTMLNDRIAKAVAAASSPKDKIRAVALGYLEFSEKQKNYYDIITYFLSTPEQLFPPRLKNRVDRTGGKILGFCIEAIEAGIRSGDFRKVNARRHTIWLWGMLHGLIQFRKMEKTILQKESYGTLVQYALENYLKTLVADK